MRKKLFIFCACIASVALVSCASKSKETTISEFNTDVPKATEEVLINKTETPIINPTSTLELADTQKATAATESTTVSKATHSSIPTAVLEPTYTPKPVALEPTHTPKPTLSPEEQKKKKITKKIINIIMTWNDISINKISIDPNLKTSKENDYIVSLYLTYNKKDTSGTIKDMLKFYNTEIGFMADDLTSISELTIFWKVPYLNSDGTNIARANLLRNSSVLYPEEEWFDNLIFKY